MVLPGSVTYFQWPDPASPTGPGQDITVKEILEKYSDDPDLLKHILVAKAEEDKRRSARDVLHTEQTRLQLRHVDLDQWHRPQVLAPLQQQALARLSEPYQAQPSPHSAHPLCPPRANRSLMHPQAQSRHASIASPSTDRQRKSDISHDQVMEALKAKIQRGNSTSASAQQQHHTTSNPTHSSASHRASKRAKTIASSTAGSSSSMPSAASPATQSSPRSAKPLLPPIDTSVGRLQSSASPKDEGSLTEVASSPDSTSPTDKVIHPRHRRARSLSPTPSSHDRVLATAVTES